MDRGKEGGKVGGTKKKPTKYKYSTGKILQRQKGPLKPTEFMQSTSSWHVI